MIRSFRTSTALLAAATALSLAAAACSDTSSDSADDGDSDPAATTTTTEVPGLPVPGADWPLVDPTTKDMDAAALADLAVSAEEAGSTCVAVVKDGDLVLEEYWEGFDASTDQEIFSATKSVTALIVGIAQDQGHLSIDEPASTYITEWQGTDSEEVTIRHLLANTSGRYHDAQTDYVEMGNTDDRTAFAIALDQEVDPDTVWIYNNAAIQTLEKVVSRATGEDFSDYAQANLFEPLGMNVEFARDAAGNANAYFGLQAGCLDMARLGLMMQNGGEWGGEQVVSEEFVEEAITPSSELQSAYGYLWWLNADGGWVHPDPRKDTSGSYWEGLPLDAYGAMGLGTQMLLVMPEDNLMVIRLGGTSAEEGAGGNLVENLGAQALAALNS